MLNDFFLQITADLDDSYRANEYMLLPITIGTSPILDVTNDAPPLYDSVISLQPSAASTEPNAPRVSCASSVPSPPNQGKHCVIYPFLSNKLIELIFGFINSFRSSNIRRGCRFNWSQIQAEISNV